MTATVALRKQDRGAASRRRILDAALALFADHGFAGTSLSALTAATGLPTSSIHHHFGSKEGVLHAVLEDRMQWVTAESAADLAHGSVDERLARLIDHSIRDVERRSTGLRMVILIMLECRASRPDVVMEIRTKREDAVRHFAKAFEAIFEPSGRALAARMAPRLAEFYLTCLEGFFLENQLNAGQSLARVASDLHAALMGLANSLGSEPPVA